MSNIYWSADAHIGHQSILKFMPNRPYASEENIQAHDEWIINLWQTTIGKHDQIYIAGDLTFRKSEDARRLLEQLPGEKYLAVGNHDWVCLVLKKIDIGIDGALAKQVGGFIDIKTLYEAILKKTGGLTPQQYAKAKY